MRKINTQAVQNTQKCIVRPKNIDFLITNAARIRMKLKNALKILKIFKKFLLEIPEVVLKYKNAIIYFKMGG